VLEVGIVFADTSAGNEIRDRRLACCRACGILAGRVCSWRAEYLHTTKFLFLSECTGFQYLCFFFILQRCMLDNFNGIHTTKPDCSNGLLCTTNVSKVLVSKRYRTRDFCVSQSRLYRKHLTNCVHEYRHIVWFISLFRQTNWSNWRSQFDHSRTAVMGTTPS